jgi:uncharacterized protein
MNIVLDTNVLIAALIARGVCNEVVEHCFRQHHVMGSEFILGELRRHLVQKFKHTDAEANNACELFRAAMEIVPPAELESPVCRDPDDDLVLATAIAGEADCIITGDQDLLVLVRYRDIRIVRPADFSQLEAGDV